MLVLVPVVVALVSNHSPALAVLEARVLASRHFPDQVAALVPLALRSTPLATSNLQGHLRRLVAESNL